jgi:nemo like kinase
MKRKQPRPSNLLSLYRLSRDCDHDVVNLLSSMFIYNPDRRITVTAALSHSYVDEGRLRYHTCMCQCCPNTPEGIRYTVDAEPVCSTPFLYVFEDELDSLPRVRDKLSRLCADVQSRHSESLQLNVNSPLYRKFANSHCAQQSERPPSPDWGGRGHASRNK